MKILVTGSAGFIGFHCTKNLLDDGFEVLGIDNLNDYYYPRSKEARSAMERNYPCEIINFGNHKSENLMDIVGIIKLIFAAILLTQTSILYLIATFGVSLLMAAAVLTHLKVKNPLYKALPSFSLMSICTFLGMMSL